MSAIEPRELRMTGNRRTGKGSVVAGFIGDFPAGPGSKRWSRPGVIRLLTVGSSEAGLHRLASVIDDDWSLAKNGTLIANG
jgi:hypothetical protein